MNSSPKVGFFVTCLVNAMRPNIGFASIKLLESAGCQVEIPGDQVCCSQPAFNNGDLDTATAMAKQLIDQFESYDYLVAPSGSCLGMIKVHFVELFEDDPEYLQKAEQLASKCFEIIQFLHDVMGISIKQEFDASVTYHDSCSGLRELDIKEQPRNLLKQVAGLRLSEMEDTDVCCGFGGTFCVKYPDISGALVSDKIDNISNTNADVLLAGDLGCLMNIAGRCKRMNLPVRCFHTVEVLAGMADVPAIGEPQS